MKKLIGYILLFSNLSFLLPIESQSQTNICPQVDFVTSNVRAFHQENNVCHYINIADVQKINDTNDRKFRVPIYTQSLNRINTEYNIYQINCNEDEYRLIKSTIWQRGQIVQNIEKVSSSFA